MPAYLLSGPPGSGKSTVGRVLASLKCRIIETDSIPGLSGWENIITREKASITPTKPYPNSWIKTYGWFWNENKMHELITQVSDEPVFFVGNARNSRDFLQYFDKQFTLFTNEEAIKVRLKQREPDRWTDDSIELKNVIKMNNALKNQSGSSGLELVDNSASPEETAYNILKVLDIKSS